MSDDLRGRIVARQWRMTHGPLDASSEAVEISPDISPVGDDGTTDGTVSRETIRHPGLVGLAFINGFTLACIAFGFHHMWLLEGLRTAVVVTVPFAVALVAAITVMVLAAREHPTERSTTPDV